MPFTGSTVPPFLRYGVSHSLLSDTRRLTANEKDPSASLGMTIRETCFPLFFYLALVIHPADRHFERNEKSFSSPFSHDSFAKPFTGSTVPAFPAIRCFLFFAIGHSPSCRQRKRSLGSARDDDTKRTRFPHTLSLHDARDIHSLHCHFERSEKSFSSPFSHDSFAKPFTGSTVSAFPRYGVSRFSLPNTRPLAANEKDPSASLGMTIRETCFPLFFYLALVIHPADRHFERSEKSFSSPFSHDSFTKPFTGSTVPAFPAIRCFPFFAIGHSPSCRQRKRSLDDDTGNVLSQHNLFPIYGNAHFPPFY